MRLGIIEITLLVAPSLAIALFAISATLLPEPKLKPLKPTPVTKKLLPETEEARAAAFMRGNIDYRGKCKRLRLEAPTPCLMCIGDCWG